MLVAYSSSTNIDFSEAKKSAKDSFPSIDFSNASDPISLEKILNENELVLFVNIDLEEQNKKYLDSENSLAKNIEESLQTINCLADSPVFTPDDLNVDLCAESSEFPTDVEITKKELDEINEIIDSIEAETSEGTNAILSCKDEMDAVTENIKSLITKEQNARETLTSLEQLLYNYRIMQFFYKKRLDEIGRILGIFDPLLERKKTVETDIDSLKPVRDAAQSDFNDIDKIISTGTYTPDQYARWTQKKSDFEDVDARYQALLVEDQSIKDQLEFQKALISSFTNDQITSNDEISNKKFLEDSINGLIIDVQNAFAKTLSFSTRTVISLPISGSPYDVNNAGQSFQTRIKSSLIDKDGILAGRKKNYNQTNNPIIIEQALITEQGHGSLYDSLYNIWGNIDLFFTREERGLTTDSNYASQDLKGTGAEVFAGSFIGDSTKFRDFYENFPQRWQDKVKSVKDSVLEPQLQSLGKELETYAIQEVQLLFAFGKAFEKLPSENEVLNNIINSLTQIAQNYISITNELFSDLSYVKSVHDKILNDIDLEKQNYQQVTCAKNTANNDSENRSPGNDPLGITSLSQTDPQNPNMTKWCYWVRFAKYATAVNTMPFPEGAGFRYWPIGMVIPNPGGDPIKIPLPIIWIPIAIIPLQVGIFVLFIGQCGLCPSPMVFYIGPNGEKKFITGMRPGAEFGSNSSTPTIKNTNHGGIGITRKISDLLNDVKIPGFVQQDPDSLESLSGEIKDNVMKKIQKLGNPDNAPFLSLSTNSTIADKKKAFKDIVKTHLNKLDLPSTVFPKSSSNINPKPSPARDVIEQLEKNAKLSLPEISVPFGEKLDLKSKLIDNLEKLKGDPTITFKSTPGNTTEDEQKFVNDISNFFKKYITIAANQITPVSMGIVSQAEKGITFLNPYKCKTTPSGFTIPSVPEEIGTALSGIKILSDRLAEGLTINTPGIMSVSADNIIDYLISSVAKGLPSINVPNPTKITIKDMLSDSSIKLSKLQLPSFPDPSQLLQPKVTISGEAVKSTIVNASLNAIDSFPLNDVNLQTMSALDVKQMIINLVENSLNELDSVVKPFIDIVNKYKPSKDKTFPEEIGLSKVSPDTDSVNTVAKQSFDNAMKVLKSMPITTYPAVAFAPDMFKDLHPILSSDDLPPWERFTLDNFLFVVFLDSFCRAGKKSAGFFENP